MLIVVVILFLSAFFGLFALTGRVIFLWLKLIYNSLDPFVYGILYGLIVLLVLGIFIASRIPDMSIPRVVFRVSHYALGILLYMMMIVNFTAFLLVLGRLLGLIPSPVPKAISLSAGTLCLILVTVLSVYGTVHAATVYTKCYTVQFGKTHGEMDSLQIALVSDLHLGYVIEEKHLEKIIAAVNETRPDIVCLAGDTFDGDITSLSNPEKIRELLKGLDAKHGVYACLGNHDAGKSYEQMLEFLSEAGVHVLQDEAAVIDGRVLLVGRKDSSPIGGQGNAREVLMKLPEANTLPVIVMDHQPGNIGEYGEEADLILCGHSHQGQMFPFNLITKAVFEVDHGYYRASDTAPQFIVTSGAGTWGPPLRVATDNEIVEIRVMFPKAEGKETNRNRLPSI